MARPARRTFLGLSAAGTAACRFLAAPGPVASNLSYGPSPAQGVDIYSTTRDRAAPLVALVHGGGWVRGSRDDMRPFIAYFTARSYVVANIGYRLAAEAKAPAAAEDVRNGIEWVRTRAAAWGADGRKLLLAGFSAGAHLALLSALAPASMVGGPQCRASAMVSFWGVTDVEDLLEGDHERDFARAWLPAEPGQRALARRLSPVRYDPGQAPPLCAVHSLHDPNVPFEHSERLVARFQQAHRPARLLKLTHAGHAAPDGDYPGIFGEVFRYFDELKAI